MACHALNNDDIISCRLADIDGESDVVPPVTAAVGTPCSRKPYDQMSKKVQRTPKALHAAVLSKN
jgi:hypothetical protein